ncbi:putative bifunctional diguanylate cyclase/phosphodiesterase, partial [Maricaulis sp. CAU 1757]
RDVAQRFRKAIGEDVHLARVGGDEFACLLIGEAQAGKALDIARTLRVSLVPSFGFEGQDFEIGAAIGIAWSRPGATKTFAQLVHDADLAMYRAKANQLDEPLCYDASLGVEQAELQALERDMEAGLKAGQFHVVYQPITRARDGKVSSLEALLRWTHPVRGQVPPDEFIPVAERSQLIRLLGDFVIASVCKEIGPTDDFTVSVNLSPTQLNDPDLCRRYSAALNRHGMRPGQIELELTEAVLVEDFDRAAARLHELHEAGFGVNLDDFGTGFSSMGYLHSLPFNKIKIDKSFVAAIGQGDGPNKMLQALALLGDALDLDIVAEGVETSSQANMLRLLGYEYLQGWHFGRPVRFEELRDRLKGAA